MVVPSLDVVIMPFVAHTIANCFKCILAGSGFAQAFGVCTESRSCVPSAICPAYYVLHIGQHYLWHFLPSLVLFCFILLYCVFYLFKAISPA